MTTPETERPTPFNSKKQRAKEGRSCRSAICGGDPFIPDSEYEGAKCDLTCGVDDVSKKTD